MYINACLHTANIGVFCFEEHQVTVVISLSLKMREKYLISIMEVSFFKISDEFLVVTHLYDAKDPLPLNANKWE